MLRHVGRHLVAFADPAMNSKTLLPYLLLLPATLFLLVFFAYPFVQVAVQAFETPTGLGAGNFQTMLRNFRF